MCECVKDRERETRVLYSSVVYEHMTVGVKIVLYCTVHDLQYCTVSLL